MGAAEGGPPEGLDYPDFMVVLPRDDDTKAFLRLMTNQVSQRMAVSHWPAHALAHRLDQRDPHEKALMLVACEKDQGVKTRCMRTWLVFGSELRWLLGFSEEQIRDPAGFFRVQEDIWRIRILNLRRWAEQEPLPLEHRAQVTLPTGLSLSVAAQAARPERAEGALWAPDGDSDSWDRDSSPGRTPRRSARLSLRAVQHGL